MALETRVILIRCGSSDWHEQGKLVGQRDHVLSERGQAEAAAAADALRGVAVTELLSSPLQRAVQTARVLGARCQIDVARDQRLAALSWGNWEGQSTTALAEEPSYQHFLQRPADVKPPGGEAVEAAQRRAVAAVEQVLSDAAAGDALVIVTHSTIIRMVLAHYLGAPVNAFMRIHVSPGSLSTMAFGHGQGPRLLALNWRRDFSRLHTSA